MAAGYTTIKYGDVTMYRVVTEAVEQQQVYDESNTDMLYSRCRYRVTGYVHGHADWKYQLIDNGPEGLSDYGGLAGYAARDFRQRLPPRQRFRMWVGCSASGNGNTVDGEIYLDINPMPLAIVPAPGPGANAANNQDQEEVVETEEDDNATSQVSDTPNFNLAGFDLANGPKNIFFNVVQITGDELFKVTAEFELCYLECPCTDCDNAYGVLSNRWSIVDSIDVDMQTTRTYSGVLVCASQNINIQSFRWLTAPPIQPQMRIDSMSFVVSADGLKLNWTVVHKEIAFSAPWPARTWNVEHTEEQIDGMNSYCYVDVNLTGDSEVDKLELIELAYYIIFAKVYGKTPLEIKALAANNQNKLASQFLLQQLSVTDHIGDKNQITARAKAWRPVGFVGVGVVDINEAEARDALKMAMQMEFGGPAAPAAGVMPGAFQTLGASIKAENLPTDFADAPPSYKTCYSWGGYPGQTPEFEGPAVIAGIFACYLQNPCDDVHGIYKDGSPLGNPSNAPDQNASFLPDQPRVVPIDVIVADEVSYISPYGSDSNQTEMYTHWQIDNVYKNKSMKVGFPIAAPPPSSGPNWNDSTSFGILARPQCRRIIRVSAERIGIEPEFPDPDNLPLFPIPVDYSPGSYAGLPDPQIKQTCLGWRLKPGTPIVTVLGQLLYRASAEYIIGLSRAPNAGERLALGNDKWNFLGNQNTSASGNLTGANVTLPGGNWGN